MTAPRLYGIHAALAPVVAVFRRGPSDWYHVVKWNYQSCTVDRGAWFRGKLYPRRSDVSSDGTFLFTFVYKHPAWKAMPNPYSGRGDVGSSNTWSQVSKLPWLKALSAWREMGTWTSGYRFVDLGVGTAAGGSIGSPDCAAIEARELSGEGCWGEIGPPQFLATGGVPPLCLAGYKSTALEVELAHGWSPEQSQVSGGQPTLRKQQPAGEATLRVHAEYEERAGIELRRNVYQLALSGKGPSPLPDVAWADWAHDGSLLIATRDGQLQVRNAERLDARPVWSCDTNGWTPDPQPAPDWAHRW